MLNKVKLEKSIAVLPFINLSSDEENEYFSDGITEEIINALAKVSELKVIARTSAFAFKGKNIDVREIGKQLGVSTVLEGSVRKYSNRVRITSQLINAFDGVHIWSENFDRDLEDIFKIQDEISLLIADSIRENFGHLEIDEHLVKTQNISPKIYELYLKAKSLIYGFNKDNCLDAISILKKVIEKEKDFALAYAEIHYAYNSMVAAGLMPRAEALSEGKKYLDKAFELEPNLPECHHSLGWHYLNDEWDFIKAEKHLAKAIELRPGYMDAYQKYFITLILEGKIEASFHHILTAYKLDPFTPLNNYFFAYYYYVTQNFEKANHFFERLYELEPNFIVGYSISALLLVLQDRPKDILQLSNRIPNIQDAELEKLILNTLAYAKLGNKSKTDKGIKELHVGLKNQSRERILYFLINIETVLGNYKNAFELMEVGISRRDPLITLLKVDPILKPLHEFEEWKNAMSIIYALSDTTESKPIKISKSIMSDKEVEKFNTSLNNYMTNNNPHLESAISLKQLANNLNIHPNKLSWFINEQIGKNFNDFINQKRLDTFMEKAQDEEFKHLSILGLAYESGFNSKTVFNAFFKKTMKMTPKTWLNSVK